MTSYDLFGCALPDEDAKKKKQQTINPCVALYGSGPVGVTCKACQHLRYPLDQATRHWKCDLRTITHGKATDHQVRWPACAKYDQRTETYTGG